MILTFLFSTPMAETVRIFKTFISHTFLIPPNHARLCAGH